MLRDLRRHAGIVARTSPAQEAGGSYPGARDLLSSCSPLAIHPNRVMRTHPAPVDDSRHMPSRHAPKPVRYEFRVRAHLGETHMQAFPELHAEANGDDTLLIGALADQAALHGVLAQIEALGLELVEVRRLPTEGDGLGIR
jgi:hypothetical protein